MPRSKFFTNRSAYTMTVTLLVRVGDDPRKQRSPTDFQLAPRQSCWQAYGDDVNDYLNGFALQAIENGADCGEQQVVLTHGCPLDEELNDYNAIDFDLTDTGIFQVTPRNLDMGIHNCHLSIDEILHDKNPTPFDPAGWGKPRT